MAANHPPTCGRIQPPVFEKHGSKSYAEFVTEFYDYLNCIESTTEQAKRMLPTLLRGEARIVYQNIPYLICMDDNIDMDVLMTELESRLFSESELELYKDEMKAMRQDGRAVHVFADQIRRTAEKAYPGSTMDMAKNRDREARESFISGLDDNIPHHSLPHSMIFSIRIRMRRLRPSRPPLNGQTSWKLHSIA